MDDRPQALLRPALARLGDGTAAGPQAAAAEIDRLGSRPDVVQILISAGSRMPYGQRFYDPVWEACERNGLIVGVHFGGIGIAHAPTSAGWPSYYLEWHTNMSQAFLA